MNYADIVNLIFTIIFTISGVLYLHFFIFGFIGLFWKKKFPKAKTQHKFGIVIPCRNEASVVGNLINSIRAAGYPQDKLNIYVMAHNCTDDTAEQARKLGVTVYEYNNDAERTKGYALKYLFEQLKKDLPNGIEENEGYFVFDADNEVSHNYFEKMNDAFEAYDGKDMIAAFRNAKNFGTNIMSGCYGLLFMNGSLLDFRGRAVCGVSAKLYGTGFLIPAEILHDGWKYLTIVEDFEFTADQIIAGKTIRYCDEAEFYDEQPTSLSVMWTQRVRWARGRLLCTLTSLKGLIKGLFSRKKEHKNKVSLYDMTIFVLPLCLIMTFLSVLQFILLLFSPLAGLSLAAVLSKWFSSLLMSGLLSYVGLMFLAILVFIAERKRIHGVSFLSGVCMVFAYPIFVLIQFLLDLTALFSKNLKWKTIPHKGTSTIKHVDNASKINTDDDSEI